MRKRGGGGANGGKRQPRGQGKGQGQGQNGGGPQIRGRSRNVRASRPGWFNHFILILPII